MGKALHHEGTYCTNVACRTLGMKCFAGDFHWMSVRFVLRETALFAAEGEKGMQQGYGAVRKEAIEREEKERSKAQGEARSSSGELRSSFVGASKFLILIMNFEDAQFETPPLQSRDARPLP